VGIGANAEGGEMSTMVYPLDSWRSWKYVSSGVWEALNDTTRYDLDFVAGLPDMKAERDLALKLIEAAPDLSAKRDLVRLMRAHPGEAIVISI